MKLANTLSVSQSQFQFNLFVENSNVFYFSRFTHFYLGYASPNPSVFSGEHRYMIFVYEQLEYEIEVPQPNGRAKFNLMSWMESFGGEDVIRGPIGSIGFKSEF